MRDVCLQFRKCTSLKVQGNVFSNLLDPLAKWFMSLVAKISRHQKKQVHVITCITLLVLNISV